MLSNSSVRKAGGLNKFRCVCLNLVSTPPLCVTTQLRVVVFAFVIDILFNSYPRRFLPKSCIVNLLWPLLKFAILRMSLLIGTYLLILFCLLVEIQPSTYTSSMREGVVLGSDPPVPNTKVGTIHNLCCKNMWN